MQVKLETKQACRENSHTQPYIDNYFKQEETYAYMHATSISYKMLLLYYPAGRKPSVQRQPSQTEAVAAQPMKRLYTLTFQLPPIDSLVTAALPNALFFPIN